MEDESKIDVARVSKISAPYYYDDDYKLAKCVPIFKYNILTNNQKYLVSYECYDIPISKYCINNNSAR